MQCPCSATGELSERTYAVGATCDGHIRHPTTTAVLGIKPHLGIICGGDGSNVNIGDRCGLADLPVQSGGIGRDSVTDVDDEVADLTKEIGLLVEISIEDARKARWISIFLH